MADIVVRLHNGADALREFYPAAFQIEEAMLCEAADEIERLRALATMMADAFGDWEEPTHDGTREWCSRFKTYLRGNVVAIATFTEDEWAAVRELCAAANAAGGDDD